MSPCRGFTLVELLVVIVIFGFLMAMVGPSLTTSQAKHQAEAEVQKLHSDLQYARMQAYAQKVTWGIWWGSGNNPFSRYEIRRDNSSPPDGDLTDTVDANAQSSSNLKLAVRSSNGAIGSITFDARGFCNVWTTLYISESNGASVDCVTTFPTRVRMGKWQWDESEGKYRCFPR